MSAPEIALGLFGVRHDRDLLEAALELGVRTIDTSSRYHDFGSHRALAKVGTDLLPEFTISTKVGFLREAGRSRHSLDPAELTAAARRTADELGRTPDALLLHNPEHTLARLPPAEAGAVLAAACEAMAAAVRAGLCGSWGISCWDPRPLLPLAAGVVVRPQTLMTRAGLLLDPGTRTAAAALADALGVAPSGRWGMNAFGGDGAQQAWSTPAGLDATALLGPGQVASSRQAALRVAFELPPVSRIAVGTGNPEHLRELVGATTLRLGARAVGASLSAALEVNG
ncbi:aldo/keto reductase [Kitasatospora sp. NBC_01287]|uniref:aldo/keto reductase n=1 Tax=Kitasatospora sp. NBC_01287 TaxID=2903573 RepID=UPI0022524938|nr:aldo/keto reductase [Kitasatospora sp. NBC_01287]MCX4746110.1 aldo/keto reductase [Kitasatospora sp. NBC_01287]